MSVNRAIFIGEISGAPELKVGDDGFPVANFVLTVRRPDGLSAQAKSDTVPCVASRQAADKVQNLTVGSVILVEGRINTRTIDQANGQRQWITDIDARDICLIQKSGSPSPVSAQPTPNILEKSDEPANFNFDDSFPKFDESTIPDEIPF